MAKTASDTAAKKVAKKAAKKAAKKTASNKAPKSAVEAAAALPGTFVPSKKPIDLLDPKGLRVVQDVVEHLHKAAARRKNKPVSFRTVDELQQEVLPYPHFNMQLATGSYGLLHGAQVNVIGPTGTGKSTLVYTCCGGNLLRGCPSLIVQGEGKGKIMSKSRMARCFNTDPAKAAIMLKACTFTVAHSLTQMAAEVEEWVKVMRSKWPPHLPLQVIIDPISKMLSPDEAAGFFDYGKNMDEENKKKFTATGEKKSNLGHSKFHHDFARRLMVLTSEFNVNVWIIHHQNVKIEMQSGPAGKKIPMSPLMESLRNTTHNGGRATDQNVALQLVMVPYSEARDAEKQIRGGNVRVMVEKNSHGPRLRVFDFEIRWEHAKYDRPGYLDPAIHFNGHFAKWLAERKLMGMRVDNNLYSSTRLGVNGLSADDMGALVWNNPALVCELGVAENIDGYSDVASSILSAVPAPPSADPAPADKPVKPMPTAAEEELAAAMSELGEEYNEPTGEESETADGTSE